MNLRPDVPTRRDSTPEAARPPSGSVWTPRLLPPALATRFEIVRLLPTRGAQADLLLVRGDGGLRVVKLYGRSVELDRDAIDLLLRAAPEHVAPIEENGVDHDVPYEVMEWFELGSLRDAILASVSLDAREAAREIGLALDHIHSLSADGASTGALVHRDLKPENILVRSFEPLDLVLADFGLVRQLHGTLTFTSAWGNGAYAPPEAGSGAVSLQGDWWSLGIILAEIAGGRHPFHGADGEWSPREIAFRLSQGPVDVSYVTDPRIRLLIQGLLVRDRGVRWGAAQTAGVARGRIPTRLGVTIGRGRRSPVGDLRRPGRRRSESTRRSVAALVAGGTRATVPGTRRRPSRFGSRDASVPRLDRRPHNARRGRHQSDPATCQVPGPARS